jgi:quercetin dioxygenase-like cupin family protein
MTKKKLSISISLTFLGLTLLSSAVYAQDPLPATDVYAGTIQNTVQEAQLESRTDTPIRTVDAGGHNVGIGVVQRAAGNTLGGALHNYVTEVYYMLEGIGTLVTGGDLIDPVVRGDAASQVTLINGPGVSGSGISEGVSRVLRKGDMVIIPAGTPHWWSSVEESVVYTVVRVDPGQYVTLR